MVPHQACTPSTEVATGDVPSLSVDAASSFDPHCDNTSSADEVGVEPEEDAVPLRSTVEASEERRLKRRRLSQKTPTPILIHLDSEDLSEVL